MRLYPDNRYGHFFLRNDLIKDYPITVRQLMGTMIPAKMEQNLCMDSLEGWAWCPDFDEIEAGAIAPDYQAVFRSDGNIHWERMNAKT